MTAEQYTDEQVSALLQAVVSGFRHAGAIEVASYPLEKVAELTGWSPVSLARDCRSRKFTHTKYGNTLGMTPTMLAEALKAATVEKAGTLRAVADDDLEAARQASLKAAGRATRSRPAA
ncbi:hypothetical protein [Actinoplanes rectilineatus]|uniref:hypothetical protein n=1 Tax=Actinoplanes rectilineatus TaxID=113571 RepID=UPI0005F277DF|nr:hypothetical protein [Actinoplanes rectilineatus]